MNTLIRLYSQAVLILVMGLGLWIFYDLYRDRAERVQKAGELSRTVQADIETLYLKNKETVQAGKDDASRLIFSRPSFQNGINRILKGTPFLDGLALIYRDTGTRFFRGRKNSGILPLPSSPSDDKGVIKFRYSPIIYQKITKQLRIPEMYGLDGILFFRLLNQNLIFRRLWFLLQFALVLLGLTLLLLLILVLVNQRRNKAFAEVSPEEIEEEPEEELLAFREKELANELARDGAGDHDDPPDFPPEASLSFPAEELRELSPDDEGEDAEEEVGIQEDFISESPEAPLSEEEFFEPEASEPEPLSSALKIRLQQKLEPIYDQMSSSGTNFFLGFLFRPGLLSSSGESEVRPADLNNILPFPGSAEKSREPGESSPAKNFRAFSVRPGLWMLILPGSPEEVQTQCRTRIEELRRQSEDVSLGLSARFSRTVGADRLMSEAFEALRRSSSEHPLICFEADPDKYKEFILRKTDISL